MQQICTLFLSMVAVSGAPSQTQALLHSKKYRLAKPASQQATTISLNDELTFAKDWNGLYSEKDIIYSLFIIYSARELVATRKRTLNKQRTCTLRTDHCLKIREYILSINIFRQAFFPTTIHDLNALPEEMVCAPPRCFKKRLQNFMFTQRPAILPPGPTHC